MYVVWDDIFIIEYNFYRKKKFTYENRYLFSEIMSKIYYTKFPSHELLYSLTRAIKNGHKWIRRGYDDSFPDLFFSF